VRCLPNYLCMPYVAMAVAGLVLLRQGDEIPKGRGSFGGFPPSDNAYGIRRSRCKRDHSVCLSAGKGVHACRSAQRRRNVIYDCLVGYRRVANSRERQASVNNSDIVSNGVFQQNRISNISFNERQEGQHELIGQRAANFRLDLAAT